MVIEIGTNCVGDCIFCFGGENICFIKVFLVDVGEYSCGSTNKQIRGRKY